MLFDYTVPPNFLEPRITFINPYLYNNSSFSKHTVINFIESPMGRAFTYIMKVSETSKIIIFPVFLFKPGLIKSTHIKCHSAVSVLAFSEIGRGTTLSARADGISLDVTSHVLRKLFEKVTSYSLVGFARSRVAGRVVVRSQDVQPNDSRYVFKGFHRASFVYE